VDHAVALVQSYLQLNGYFTTAEYPIIEAIGDGSYRSLTDIDILAFRFPGSFQALSHHSPLISELDPMLGNRQDRVELLIAEVKEGKTHLNEPARDIAVLAAAVARFGCVDDCDGVAANLMTRGSTISEEGYAVQMVMFGGLPRGTSRVPYKVISLGHVLKYLQDYVRKNWAMLRHIQVKDPAFGFLMTLEKARRGERRTRVKPPKGVEGRGWRLNPRVAPVRTRKRSGGP
jgi:hypothetical protein